MSKSEKRELLEKEIACGELADNAKALVFKITNKIIEDCKEEFSTAPVKYYQNSDNNPIFVLQLKIAIAREMQSEIDRLISDGEIAKNLLAEAVRDGRE